MIVLQVALAGAFGTGFMTLLMSLVHRAGWSNGDL